MQGPVKTTNLLPQPQRGHNVGIWSHNWPLNCSQILSILSTLNFTQAEPQHTHGVWFGPGAPRMHVCNGRCHLFAWLVKSCPLWHGIITLTLFFIISFFKESLQDILGLIVGCIKLSVTLPQVANPTSPPQSKSHNLRTQTDIVTSLQS